MELTLPCGENYLNLNLINITNNTNFKSTKKILMKIKTNNEKVLQLAHQLFLCVCVCLYNIRFNIPSKRFS